MEQLRENQKLLRLTYSGIHQEVNTRWNSTFLMLKHLIDNRKALLLTLQETKYSKLLLNLVEWKAVEDIHDVFGLFKYISERMSENKYVTLFYVFPSISVLRDYCKPDSLVRICKISKLSFLIAK